MVYPAAGTIIGCWVGVIPIALDWDRPWQVRIFYLTDSLSGTHCSSCDQAWPLTPAFGSIAGFILASIYALTISSVRHLAEANRSQLARAKRD